MSDVEAPTAVTRLRGTVRARNDSDAPVLVRARLDVQDGPGHNARHGDAFELLLGDGSIVAVDAGAPGLRLLPWTRARGRWSSLEHASLAAWFRDRAPGPHVVCTLRGASIAPGDELELLGTPLGDVPDPESIGGLRDAARGRPSVRALIVATGAGAAAALDAEYARLHPPLRRERPARRLQPLGPLAARAAAVLLVCVAAGLLALMAARPGEPGLRLGAFEWSCFYAAFAMFTGLVPHYPEFAHGATDKGLDPNAGVVRGTVGLIAVSSVLWIPLIALAEEAGRANGTTGARASTGFAVLSLLVTLVAFAWARRRTMRTIDAMLGARPFGDKIVDGQWGAADGVVRDPTPIRVDGDELAVARVHDVTHEPGSDPDTVTTSVVQKGTFLVATRAAYFEVDATGALWGTTVTTRKHVSEGKSVRREVIPQGGRARVVGRVARSGPGSAVRFVGAGAQSLLLFATSADEDPRARLRSVQRLHRGVLIAMLALTLAAVGAAVAAWGSLPPPTPADNSD